MPKQRRPPSHTTPVKSSKPIPPPPPQSEFVVEAIFPKNEVHLWGGPSHVGKTTLLFQTIDAWRDGRPIFGYKSFPSRFCYVSCERSKASALLTLNRIGIDTDERSFPILSLLDDPIDEKSLTFESVHHAADKLVQGVEVLFVDGGVSLVRGDINRYDVVADFVAKVIRYIRTAGITVFIIVGPPKTKEGERYTSSRQKFIGSAAWSALCTTGVMIESDRPDDARCISRTVTVTPPNNQPKILRYNLDTPGRFVISPNDADDPTDFELVLFARDEGTLIEWSEIEDICDILGISGRTGRRYLDKLVADGRMTFVRHGVYAVPKSQ